MNRFAADVANIPLACKRLEEALAEHDPKLLATLRPPHRGFRLLSREMARRSSLGAAMIRPRR